MTADADNTHSVGLRQIDRWRRKIPFWWWLTYDAIVGIVLGTSVRGLALVIGGGVLLVAVVIDTCEAIVKSPWVSQADRMSISVGEADLSVEVPERD